MVYVALPMAGANTAWVAGAVLVGLAAGTGGYTFVYARGASYLANDPSACANCHVMQQHLDGWIHSSHRAVAVCNDCHLPAGLLAKVGTKLDNGFWHALAFTLDRAAEPLRIRPHNRDMAESACRSCHGDVADAMLSMSTRGQVECSHCHASVGHWY